VRKLPRRYCGSERMSARACVCVCVCVHARVVSFWLDLSILVAFI